MSESNRKKYPLSVCLCFNGHFSKWTWVSQYQDVCILDFIGVKDAGGGGDNWNYKTCEELVKFSLPVNQRTVCTGWMPFFVAQPAV